jgi:hypothetical protein
MLTITESAIAMFVCYVLFFAGLAMRHPANEGIRTPLRVMGAMVGYLLMIVFGFGAIVYGLMMVQAVLRTN